MKKFFFLFASVSYATFAPFSLTNEKAKVSLELPEIEEIETITTKEEILKDVFLEEPQFKPEEKEKMDWQDKVRRLEEERKMLLTKEEIEEPTIEIEEPQEKGIEEPQEKEIEQKKEPKEDLTLLAKMASDRVASAEKRRQMLRLDEKEYERLKTTPGEALRLKLPEESELNVLGRKFIKMGYSGKNLLNTTEKQKTSNQVNIEQELEVKIRGIVKKKVSVNVDYSDKSTDVLAPKRTFEVKYTGEKEEVIQEAVFGDVSLVLPQSRFTGYKKSGFGISTKAQALNKKLNISAIASREKGESRSKSFKGTTTQRLVNLNDTGFIKRRFYQVLAHIEMQGEKEYRGRIEWLKKKGYLPIRPGSFQLYIDDKNPNNNTSGIPPLTGTTYDFSGSYTGSFDLKYPGDDYSFDYNTGILSFKYPLSDNDVVLVSYIDGLGFQTTNLILKNERGEQIKKPELYELFELKGYYSLPAKRLPDLSFEIRDAAGKYWYDLNNNNLFDAGELTYVRIFGLDREKRYDDGQENERPGYNKIDKEFLDLDLGYIIFPDRLPFEFGTSGSYEKNRFYYEDRWFSENILPLFSRSTLTLISNPNCYKENPQAKYTIRISYSSEEKYGFSLNEINIVPDSEVIYINGNRLSRSEYSIDYETGWITIYRKIQPTDDIKVDYEYAPFFGVYQKSLLGTRFDYQPSTYFSLGGTYIGESGKGLKGAPSVTHPSTSLSVVDIGSKFSLTNLLKERDYNGPISLELEGEIAHSIQNPNTYGYGMIDNMDTTEDSIDTGISESAWQIGSLKKGTNQTPRGKIFYYDEEENKMYPYSERCGPYISDGGHRSDEKQEKQKMLNFNLSLGPNPVGTNSEGFVSLVTNLSKEGIDISDYSFIEVWSNIPSSSTIKFYLDIGIVSEDADGDGNMDTEDVNKDGYLNPGEDVGFLFGAETRVGAKNGELDSEDLDKDGVLDTSEAIFSYFINDYKYLKDTGNTAAGWKLYSIPLSDFKSKDPEVDIRVIKHLRIRFENPGTQSLNTIFNIDKIAIVGSNWEKPVIVSGTGSISLLGKNSKEDADYVSLLNDPEYKKLHEKEDMKEEGALSISYNFATLTSAYIRKALARTQNYNPYRTLGFWVYSVRATQTLSLRFGQDANNYFQYNLGTISQGWHLIKINLSIFNELLTKKGTQSGSYLVIGSPNLGRINEIRFILTAKGEGEIWLNELHLSDVIKREANSYFVGASGGWKGWLALNFNTKKQDGEFRTIGPPSQGEEIDSTHLDAKITRFSFLPNFVFNYDKNKKDLSYGNVDEISNQKFGNEETEDKRLDLTFDYNKKKNKGFPVLSLLLKENDFLYNYSDKNNSGKNREISGNTTHQYNFKRAKSSLSTSYGFSKKEGRLSDYLNRINSNEQDAISHSAKTTLSFAPFQFLSGSNVSFEKQMQDIDTKYPEKKGTGTLEKSDKDIDIASLVLKFYPKGPIPKILPKSSFTTDYSITNAKEDVKTSYEGIPENKILQRTEKDNIKEAIGVGIFPYRTNPFETYYNITNSREAQDSNLVQHRYKTETRAQSSYILHRDPQGSLTIVGNKISFGQNEAKTKDDKSLLLTHRNIKYDLDRMEIKKLRFIPFIASTRVDKKFYFLEDYDISTDRRIFKKRASTSSHLGINNTFPKIKWKDYSVSLSTEFILSANAGYDNLPKDEETLETLLNVYNDFHRGLLFKRRGAEGGLYKKAKRISASNTRSFGIKGDWYLYPPLTTNSKITLTLKEEENGVLWSDAISNEINNTLELLKAKPGLAKRFTSSSLKLNYKIDYSHQYTRSALRSEGITHNPYIEWNANWRNNLKTTTIFKTSLSNSKEASGVITKNIEVYPSISASYDYTKPGLLKLPLINKAISLERKLVLSSKLDTSFKRKRKGKIQEVNEDNYKFDVSGTYRIQENTSGTLGFNLSYFTDRIKAGRDYIDYGSYISLEFRF